MLCMSKMSRLKKTRTSGSNFLFIRTFNQWRIYIVKFWMCFPPLGPISVIFMQFSDVEMWTNNRLAPPLGNGLDPPLLTAGGHNVYLQKVKDNLFTK